MHMLSPPTSKTNPSFSGLELPSSVELHRGIQGPCNGQLLHMFFSASGFEPLQRAPEQLYLGHIKGPASPVPHL